MNQQLVETGRIDYAATVCLAIARGWARPALAVNPEALRLAEAAKRRAAANERYQRLSREHLAQGRTVTGGERQREYLRLAGWTKAARAKRKRAQRRQWYYRKLERLAQAQGA